MLDEIEKVAAASDALIKAGQVCDAVVGTGYIDAEAAAESDYRVARNAWLLRNAFTFLSRGLSLGLSFSDSCAGAHWV
jgi:hypothetical protein